MIHLTRLNGPGFTLNPDLIQKAESTPDTIILLVDGTKYVVAESVEELTERIVYYRASVVALAQHLATEARDDAHVVLAEAVPLRPRRRQ